MKRVLVISAHSQTGQLRTVVDSVMAPLKESPAIEVVEARIEPVEPYPFPWPFLRFFDTFPETVYEQAPAVQPLAIDTEAHYDLIILAYQVWFLSPALPMTAFLQSEAAAKLLRDRPVVTLIACRNMWLMAQERVREQIRALGGYLVDHIALTDRTHSAATFISTPAWMLTGRRGPFLGGLIPAAGIPEQDIAGARRFGDAIARALPDRASSDTTPMLKGLGAVRINERLIASEKIARRSFHIWGALLRKAGPPGAPLRRCVLVFYIVFLAALICTVVPVSAVLKRLLAPLTKRRVEKEIAYYAAPSGEGSGRTVKLS